MCKAVMAERLITWAELRQHTSAEDLWVSLQGKVYDLTAYQHAHPGGALILKHVAGDYCPVEIRKRILLW